jgi:excinuclease ABC subunit C
MAHPLKNLLQDIPKAPGVYFWYGQKGEVLYVGRAVNLKNRLSQYFQKRIDSRIAEMVAQARDLKFMIETRHIFVHLQTLH